MKVFCAIFAAVAGMMATGCATTQGVRVYPGEPRPVETVAQLVASTDFDVKSIDGLKMRALGGMMTPANGIIYELLPGRHEIIARYYSPFENVPTSGNNVYDKPDRSEFQTLNLDAAAGQRYAIQGRTEDRNIVLSINGSGAAQPLGTAAVALKTTPEPAAAAKIVEPAAPATVNAPPANAVAPAKDDRVEAPRITPLDNLKQWWFYASPAERAQFRMWIDAAK